MYPRNGQKSLGSVPEPDLGSGALALQTIDQTTSASKMQPPHPSSKVKPNIPQRKTHVDEMYRLRRDLEDATRAKDDAIEMRSMMEEDLLQTQDELQEKAVEVERLSKQVHELNVKLAETDARLKQTTAAPNNRDTEMHRSRLDVGIESKVDQLRSQLDEEQQSKYAAQAELKIARETFEKRLLEAERSASIQIEAEKKRAQAFELASNEQMNRMEIDSGNQQHHDQTIAKLEEEIREQRQRCNQFRKTSERLTTQIKQANDAKASLERSDRESQQRMEDMKSKIAALEVRVRGGQMPGSFSSGYSHKFS
jgi:chromosome segregation ATPase